jgi:hypothetical protein
MWASLISALLGSLTDSLLKGLFGLVSAEIAKRQNIAQGQAQQAAAETAQSASTEAKIAAAEASSPNSIAGAVQQAKEGKL